MRILAERAGAKDHLILRNERLLKIGLMLSIGDEISQIRKSHQRTRGRCRAPDKPLSEDRKEAVRLLQVDMPLEAPPVRLYHRTSVRPDQRT